MQPRLYYLTNLVSIAAQMIELSAKWCLDRELYSLVTKDTALLVYYPPLVVEYIIASCVYRKSGK